MRVIAHRSLVLFYTKHPEAETALEEWYHKTIKAEWDNFAEMKKTFNSVDSVGNQHYVFNVKGNDYRLIAIIKFKLKIVYVRYIGTHKDYDKLTNCAEV